MSGTNPESKKHSTAPPSSSGKPANYSRGPANSKISTNKNFSGLQVLPDERIPDQGGSTCIKKIKPKDL